MARGRQVRLGTFATSICALAVLALTLSAAAAGAVTKTFSSGNLSREIARDGRALEKLKVPAHGKLKDVDLMVRMKHPDLSNLLSVELSNPEAHNIAQTLELVSGGSFTGADLGTGGGKCASQLTVFDDEALTPIGNGIGPYTGSYAPEPPGLSNFDREKMSGKWELFVENGHDDVSGALYCWKLRITCKPAG